MKYLENLYTMRYGRWEYVKKFGVKCFIFHFNTIYGFRRKIGDSIVKSLYRAIKYAGTL